MENWSSGNKTSMQHPETKHEGGKPFMKVKTSGLSPSSSPVSSPTSSDSSLELTSRRNDPLGEADASLSASSSSPDHAPNQTPQWSMMSASPRGEAEAFPDFFPQTPEWNGANPAPMKSPPMHTNGHPPGYDPNRIPSSIFASKPNNGMEWSTASNESLFSIHMGNNSFSRDQYNMYRSGELIKPDEWSNSPYNAPEVKSNEKKNLPPNLPPLVEVDTDREVKSETTLESPRMQDKIVESCKIVSVENHENNIKEKEVSNVDEVQHSASAPNKSDDKAVPQFEASYAMSPRFSNESGNSSSSFAFPVLFNDAGKAGSLNVPSAKMERPQPQPQPQPHSPPEMQPQSPQKSESFSKPESKQPESQPKLAATTWFSRFSCWPRCC